VSQQHAIFYAVGLILGGACGLMIGQSFAAEHGRRKVLPVVVPLTLVAGLVLGWALNAWNDYVHASATMPFGP